MSSITNGTGRSPLVQFNANTQTPAGAAAQQQRAKVAPGASDTLEAGDGHGCHSTNQPADGSPQGLANDQVNAPGDNISTDFSMDAAIQGLLASFKSGGNGGNG